MASCKDHRPLLVTDGERALAMLTMNEALENFSRYPARSCLSPGSSLLSPPPNCLQQGTLDLMHSCDGAFPTLVCYICQSIHPEGFLPLQGIPWASPLLLVLQTFLLQCRHLSVLCYAEKLQGIVVSSFAPVSNLL